MFPSLPDVVGEHYNGYQLRAIAAEMQHNIEQIPMYRKRRSSRGFRAPCVWCSAPRKLSAYGLSPMAIVGHLQAANASAQAGSFAENNQEVRVDAGNLFTNREDLEAVVVGVVRGHPVYLRDVAEKIVDGAAEPANYVVYGTAERGHSSFVNRAPVSAVTITRPSARVPTPPILPTRFSSECMICRA